MKYCLQEADATIVSGVDDDTEVRRLFDASTGCERFSQRVLRFRAGRSRPRLETASDEVLYVLRGSAAAVIEDRPEPIQHGAALFVAAGTTWSVEVDDELELLSVIVHDPEPASSGHEVVPLGNGAGHQATAGREFSLGVTPEVGCVSVTQFVGFIPPGRAPDHFHRYDEVIYVLEGEGALHIDGEQAPLGPGSCIHLPARLVHCLENAGDSEMRVLGVFRPAGSPAEAYYPDGRPAVVGES
jgi:mannose-6-phosphate isomerase-like protein (cupin superfamily)